MDHYAAIAKNYDEFEQTAITLWRLGYPVVEDLLGDILEKTVLDYGCGTGTFSRFLHSKGALVTGVDVSKNMIDVAKKNNPDGISYFAIESGALDFLPVNSFDFVVSNFVLCTISTQEEILLILRQIHRVLKDDGSFIFMNSNWDKSNGKEFISFKLDRCKELISGCPITAIIKSDPPISLYDFFWSVEDYRKMLMDAGFTVTVFREEIANNDDIAWLDEKEFPPYYVISARK